VNAAISALLILPVLSGRISPNLEYIMTGTMTLPPESANGRHRRSLNDTITRLDEMIDGLSQAIPDTIRDTLKEAIAESISLGVKAAVVQVLTSRELLNTLRPQRRSSLLRKKLAGTIRSAGGKSVRWVRRALRALTGSPGKVRERARLIWGFRRPLAIAMAIGAVVGFAAAWTPSWVAATLTGMGTACLSLAVQAGLWARRSVAALLAI
jgi:hypothetical protein